MRIIAPVPFLGRGIANKDTTKRSRVKLIMMKRRVGSKTNTSEHTWNEIGAKRNMRKEAMKTVNRRGLIYDTRGKAIQEINGS